MPQGKHARRNKSDVKPTSLEAPEVATPKPESVGLTLPENVTLSWLFRHVPISFWFWAIGIVVAAFLAGLGQTGFVREILRFSTEPQSTHNPMDADVAASPVVLVPQLRGSFWQQASMSSKDPGFDRVHVTLRATNTSSDQSIEFISGKLKEPPAESALRLQIDTMLKPQEADHFPSAFDALQPRETGDLSVSFHLPLGTLLPGHDFIGDVEVIDNLGNSTLVKGIRFRYEDEIALLRDVVYEVEFLGFAPLSHGPNPPPR